MVGKPDDIEAEAAILKKIDEQVKNLSPEIRKEAFQILVQRHLTGAPQHGLSRSTRDSASQNRKKERGRRTTEQPTIVKDLNLKADNASVSLRDFWSKKKPHGFLEHNTVFVYYLTMVKKAEGINQNHIYTCYKDVGARIPGAFYQSLLDTARRKGWLDTQDTQNIRVTTVGENFVEHDLPRQVAD